ncbi:MAG TPA: hypothetical protein VI072_21180 [Polyangiaceae bacterium]
MSDSFTCRVDVSDSSVRVNCEPDPNDIAATPPLALPRAVRAGEVDAGTAELLKRFSVKLTPQLPQPPSSGDVALRCLGEVSGVALGMVGATAVGPMIGVLGAFKAGYDVGKCVALERNEAHRIEGEARAFGQCETRGGVPVGAAGGVVTCLVLEGTQP